MNGITFVSEIPLWGVITMALTFATAIFSWVSSRRKDTDARFKQGSKRMDDHARRLDLIDRKILEMPGRDDVHKLELMLAGMVGDMKAMATSMESLVESQKRLEAISSRHEDFLRSGK